MQRLSRDPNVLSVFGACAQGDSLLLVMEYAEVGAGRALSAGHSEHAMLHDDCEALSWVCLQQWRPV